ncbi:hypothetical protein [Actinacidiphila guanduensis]|uniref:Uncharacterized protein n=1 Tax=Actinacidiphila guanduensis TaxID=310781 RepID=A0A1H0P4I5_9ACTN|nr:hypothetical protein [Actinacidiphila guanduensis]SDO99590.1 hypothetical protein SAMN05216259_11546 [Actinacidiphila guanduensis]
MPSSTSPAAPAQLPHGGGTFSGIDPERLPLTIGALERDARRLHDSAARLRARFAHCRIDTAPLDRLLAISAWAGGQLPMLRRRQHLAAATGEFVPYYSLVPLPDGAPGSSAEAAADGTALATRFGRSLAERNGAVPEALFAALAANCRDGDFLAAFYASLGPRRLSQLSAAMAANPYDDRYLAHPDQLAYDRDLVSRTFAAYTRVAADTSAPRAQHAFWTNWLDRFDHPGQGFRPDLLLPFVDSGTYDPRFLVALADRVFTPGATHDTAARMSGSPGAGPWEGDHYAQLWTALARSPAAAGAFVALRPDIVADGLHPGGGNTTPERTSAFVAALTAATVTLRATDPALSDRNTAWLVTTTAAPTAAAARPLPQVSLLYSEILAQHWDDLQYAITSPAQDAFWPARTWSPTAFARTQNPTRPGLELHPAAWSRFMRAAIRSPQAAASMSALFETYANKLSARISSAQRSNNESVDFMSFQMGLSDNFYSDAFSAAQKQMGDGAQAWADSMTNFRKGLVLAAVAFATGGREGASELGREKGQEYAADLLAQWVGQYVQVPVDRAPKELVDGIRGLKNTRLETTWRSAFATRVAEYIQQDFASIGKVTFRVPGEAADGSTYSGNPYAPRGSEGPRYITGPKDDFVAAVRRNGGQVDPTRMTPPQQDAYTRWLQDPAVAAKLGDDRVYLQVLGQG